MAESGAALSLPQSGLTGNRLATIIADLLHTPGELDQMARAARARARPDAAERILDRIGFLSG